MSPASVDPSSISMPSPDASEFSEPGPSRKRQRTAASSEERKDARAHRNRIAAQNSRDRRKAQFSYLEQRVTELEEENRQLRAGLVVPASQQDKDRENEELRERIRTLEKGWDVVMKALAAQGLPTSTTSTTPPSTSPQPTPEPTQQSPPPPSAPEPMDKQDSFLEPTITFPISPAPTVSSLDFDLASSPLLTPKTEELDIETTRHLARVASTVPTVALQRTMENLFLEILAPSPHLITANLPLDVPAQGPTSDDSSPSTSYSPQVTAAEILGLEGMMGSDGSEINEEDAQLWSMGAELEVDMLEMDRILELLPAADAAFQQNLDEQFNLGVSWAQVGAESNLVNVF
ncbi:BZIP domain-containing protein [Mycena indigotica]|uniref:X-box-binding protein 1 n=1 Tax=Mycena indigotica TaxID=2126181 RepID=A0A8H6WK74_9AGAR|nr:BZIP domain-containing protein [Mycena indigotica]KAF7315429.1 BZIP domain-containing protein [Mycena indigotica]